MARVHGATVGRARARDNPQPSPLSVRDTPAGSRQTIAVAILVTHAFECGSPGR